MTATAPFYPLLLDLRSRPCLVIGGGVVAERKASGLLEVGAHVTVISPAITARLASWADTGAIRHVAREYRRGDLASCALAFVATDDPRITAAAASEARERRTWVNAADDPAHCDFILPAVLRRGDLVVAVATSGASPALARRVREELQTYLGDEYGVLAGIAAEVRRDLRERGARVDPERWNAALGPEVRRLILANRRDEAKALLLRTLGEAACA
jgi:siroheme synthase-like protein